LTVTPLIVGLGGSTAAVSHSRAALAIALGGAEAAGATTRLLDIRELDLPLYNPDDDRPTEPATAMLEAIYEARGLLLSSPLYQGTISGALKNALDWLTLLGDREPSYLTDKVVGLISTAGGAQGLQAINTMEFCVRALRAWAVPYVVPVASAGRAFDDAGRIQDPAIEGQLQMLGREVVRVAKRFAAEEAPDHAAECARATERVAAVGQVPQRS
jgi:FMN reductase